MMGALEAAGIEPTPGGAQLPAESRPYLVTARNAWESSSRCVPFYPVLFQAIPQAPATYVQHGSAEDDQVGAGFVSGKCSRGSRPGTAHAIVRTRSLRSISS